jgi:hypothetical protein
LPGLPKPFCEEDVAKVRIEKLFGKKGDGH